MRVLVFGDSIAYGEFDSQGGWVERLRLEKLGEQAQKPFEDVPGIYNLGISGEVTGNLTRRLPHEVVARRNTWGPQTDFVLVFAVGINDSQVMDDGNAFSQPARFARDLEDLYETAWLFSRRLLFVGLTPVDDDHPCNKNYQAVRVWEFEKILRQFVTDHQLGFVPLYELFDSRLHEEELLCDGLHPNDEGHRLICDAVAPKLAELLQLRSILGR